MVFPTLVPWYSENEPDHAQLVRFNGFVKYATPGLG